MTIKNDTLKEQFREALISTAKAISDDYKINSKKNENEAKQTKNNFVNLTSLSNKDDFIKLRAEADSGAVKKKFSSTSIFNKNLPKNKSCKSLYDIAEKTRYEILGGKMLKGIKKKP